MKTTTISVTLIMMLMVGCRQPMVEVNGCFMPRDEAIRRGLISPPMSEKERREYDDKRQKLAKAKMTDGDTLFVAIDAVPSLNGEYIVQPDGNLRIGYLNNIYVLGLTENEAAVRIKTRVDDIFLNTGGVRTELRNHNEEKARQRTIKQLKAMVIDEIEFRQANPSDVFDFLQKRSRDPDPIQTKEIPNIGLGEPPTSNCPPRQVSGDPFSADSDKMETNSTDITFSARYISLYELYDKLCRLAGVEWSVDGNGSVILKKKEADRSSHHY